MQNALVSAYGYWWKKRRYGGAFEDELYKCKNHESMTIEALHEYQTLMLRKLLQHAFQNVPFYSRKYKAAGFIADDFKRFELEDLKKLPILEKEELRKFGNSTLLSSNRDKMGSFFLSSGSTGTPVQVYLSEFVHQKIMAAYEARVRNWAGLDRAMARGMIGGRRVVNDANAEPPYFRYNIFEKQVYFSAYHINNRNSENYLYGMRKHGIAYMSGYAMSNYHLAQFFLEKELTPPQLKAILTSSEKLTAPMRLLLNKTYQCETFDAYSSVENCGLISENEFHQKLISEDIGIVEVLDEFNNDTTEGALISTGFLNFDQPLIRYRIGDFIKLADQQEAKCKRPFRIVEEVIGRTEDVVLGLDGRKMVRFHSLFLDIKNLQRAQIIQQGDGEIEIIIQAQQPINKEGITLIEQRLKSQLGDVNTTFTMVNEIPLTLNGKFKAVISNIKLR